MYHIRNIHIPEQDTNDSGRMPTCPTVHTHSRGLSAKTRTRVLAPLGEEDGNGYVCMNVFEDGLKYAWQNL